MDKRFVYTGEIPRTQDILQIQNNAQIAMANLAFDLALSHADPENNPAYGSGSSTMIAGFKPSFPGAMQITLDYGRIYQLAQLDAQAFSTIGTDARYILQQGQADPQTLTFAAAPGTSGQSRIDLIQVALNQLDTNMVAVNYYNASNPSQPLSGPGGTGTTQPLDRKQSVTVSIKQGTPGTSPTAPTPDSGYVAAFYVTIANGTTVLSASNIAPATNAPWIGGLTAQHHLGTPGTAPQVVLGTETQGNLPSAQLPGVTNVTFSWDDTNKRLGIGKANPTVALDVVGTGSFTMGINIGGNTAIDANRNATLAGLSLIADQSQKLVIGRYSSANPQTYILPDSSNTGGIYFQNPGQTLNTFILDNSGNGTFAGNVTSANFTSAASTASGYALLQLNSDQGGRYFQAVQRGSTATPANFSLPVGSFEMITQGCVMGVGTRGAYDLVLGTNAIERMRITSGGNVLVGTTADNGTGAKLQVAGAGSFSGSSSSYVTSLATSNTYAGGGAFSILNFGGTVGNAVAGDTLLQGAGNILVSPNAAGKAIKLIPGVWTNTPALTILDGGNVGLGTQDPKTQLQFGDRNHIFALTSPGPTFEFARNAYYSGSNWIRDVASNYTQTIELDSNGNIGFYTNSDANSTAGSQITWGARLFVTQAGSVFVGSTLNDGTGAKFQVAGGGSFMGTTASNPGRVIIDDNGAYNPRIRLYKWAGGGSMYLPFHIVLGDNGDLQFRGPSNGGAGYAIGSETVTTGVTISQQGDLASNSKTLAAIDRIAMSSTSIMTVRLYDTSRDSDGGAWRKRCQHTSWYNETLNTATRGKTKEFPAIALIVAETTKVTVYDMTDPTLPMWIVFNSGASNALPLSNCSSITAQNGRIFVGQAAWLIDVSFLADTVTAYSTGSPLRYKGSISQRHSALAFMTISGPSIANNAVNDLAATVLPGAPIDPSTSLLTPTVAVATAGGVSVIKHDGTVVNSADTSAYYYVALSGKVLVYSQAGRYTFVIDDVAALAAGWANGRAFDYANAVNIPNMMGQASCQAIMSGRMFARGSAGGTNSTPGLVLAYDNPMATNQSMVARVTSTYASGWQPGDIRGAWLASTTAETLSGAELVTNGGFDTDTVWTKGTGWSISSGVATKAAGAQSNLQQAVSAIIGKRYALTFTISGRTAGGVVPFVGADSYNGGNYYSANGTYTIYLTCAQNAGQVVAGVVGDNLFVGSIDNVSIHLCDDDRSVKGKDIAVYGSMTKSAVATGADLVAYSGWSASNYEEQAYNSDLDFGTGDFAIFGWLLTSTSGVYQQVIDRRYKSGSTAVGGGVALYLETNGSISVGVTDDGWATRDSQNSGTAFNDGVWHLVAMIVRSGKLELWVDSRKLGEVAITAAALGVSQANALLRIGLSVDSASQFGGSLALWRATAYAPTAEQIRFIYEQERFLFQANAKCTLSGSSVVQGLAYDPDTDQLYAATAAGTSILKGLVRVDARTNQVATSTNHKTVAAVRGMWAISTAAEAEFAAPQRSIREEIERVRHRMYAKQLRTDWFTADGVKTDFDLTVRASTIQTATNGGVIARGVTSATKATQYQVLDYGYKQTIRFGAAPAANEDIGISYYEEYVPV